MSNLSPSLQTRIQEFLPTVRVGIDFGEHAGGIAVVRGNEILHAETFVDFHDATLEQRRTLRRGRRTRHAKKMRLARLRSWVLRQEVPQTVPGTELRNGKARLPDPYKLLSNGRRYWVQPGLYRESGKAPQDAPSWIDLAKRGEVDAEGFVWALTLIFKKRGYKWDDRSLSEMSDSELKEFLERARIPTETSELRNEIEREIRRREENPDDPARGKKKEQLAVLRALLADACTRPRRPRIAEHRSVKEQDLRDVIDGFGRARGLPEDTIKRWRRELAGEKDSTGKYIHYGLLNKTIRLARFDNRIRSGCAWCGKKTPRKTRLDVRERAYRAAVNNLRAVSAGRERPLTELEKEPFLVWWSDRQKAPGISTIRKRLLSLNPRQKAMANQLYDLLKNDRPTGRASLCEAHLGMAAEGRTMKDAGVAWQTLSVRNAPNPAREQHDIRVLARLERIIFHRGKRGPEAWKLGPVGLISLEVPEPQTQRSGRGQVPERKVGSFRERLLGELGGQCVYCDRSATREDHIFPKSRGGPDVWENLIAACEYCNEQLKGERTPFEWFGNDQSRWVEFKRKIEGLSLSARKKQILLNETTEFPGGDPTPFARVGARPRQFVAMIRDLFEKKYGVTPPELFYQTGQPHIQRVTGSLTARLRRSWRTTADGSENFPEKSRLDLYNHAQDAALIAACPPHTWRDTIFVHKGSQPGLAVPDLAPNWRTFANGRRFPLVRILGNYTPTWRRSLFAQTLWADPNDLEAKRGIVYVPMNRLTVSTILQSGNGEGIVSESIRLRLQEIVLGQGWDRLDKKKRDRQAIPDDLLERNLPGICRVKVYRQRISGVWVPVHPKDGPRRKLMADPKAASEGAVFWVLDSKPNRLGISVIRPGPLLRFGVPRLDPPPPPGAIRLWRWMRNEIVWLEADTRRGYPAGWYRLKEFSDSDVKVLPENSVPLEIANRMGIKRDKSDADRRERDPERKLGKRELLAYRNRLADSRSSTETSVQPE